MQIFDQENEYNGDTLRPTRRTPDARRAQKNRARLFEAGAMVKLQSDRTLFF